MVEVRWTLQGLDDLEAICLFIARDAPPFAAVEVLAEFNLHKDSPGTLERELKIETPYRLLPDNEGKGPSTAKDIFTLENVYFNQKRSLALTYRFASCGTLCGSGGWIILEKGSDGNWKKRSEWAHCRVSA